MLGAAGCTFDFITLVKLFSNIFHAHHGLDRVHQHVIRQFMTHLIW